MSYEIIRITKRSADLSFQLFGRVLVIAPVQDNTSTCTTWLCVCHCGAVVTRTSRWLKKTLRPSCGCLGYLTRHWAFETREYSIWRGMKTRCTNPRAANFHWYGGRGITVCDSWLNSFDEFYRDMGRCQPGESIDRIDNDGMYSPENCRWTNHKTQVSNKRNNRFITYNGETNTITEWARKLNLIPDTLYYRINKGWPIDRAFQPPMNTGRPATSHNSTHHKDNC